MEKILEEANKRFDDAIYRVRTGNKQTAEDLWKELAVVQNSNGDGWAVGIRAMGIIRELVDRKQTDDPFWGGRE